MTPAENPDWVRQVGEELKPEKAGLGGDSNRDFRPDHPKMPTGKDKRRRRGEFRGRLLTSKEFMATMNPPEYLIDGLLMVARTYTLTGNTGHGKTLLAMLWAIAVAMGHGFCGRVSLRGSVAFFAGENPENAKMQWYSMCSDLGIDPAALSVFWYEGVFSIDQAREKLAKALRDIPDLRLCIFDSLQAFFMGDDDSANMAMLDLAIDFRSMSEVHPRQPTVIILAHPVKNAKRDVLLPRGGSALTNELDGNLTLWLDEGVATLHWLGKLRGVPFEPIKFEVVVVKPEGLVDAKGYQMSCTVIRPIMAEREAELARQGESRRRLILAQIRSNPKVKGQELADAIGQSKATANRIVSYLITAKWIKRYGASLILTAEGLSVLEDDLK